MFRLPPTPTRTDPLFPSTTRFRSPPPLRGAGERQCHRCRPPYRGYVRGCAASNGGRTGFSRGGAFLPTWRHSSDHIWKIGRAHVRTPVTNAQLVCRLLLEKKKTIT